MNVLIFFRSDGCGVCNGDNSEKDCTGVCWGTASNCTNKSAYHQTLCNIFEWDILTIPLGYYVSTTGSTSGTGTISNPFSNVQQAINASSYGDTVQVQAGVYSVSTPISFFGKTGITITKDPLSEVSSTVVKCTGASNFAFAVSNGESFDTKIDSLTIQSCGSTAIKVSGGASLSVNNVIVQNNTVASNIAKGTRFVHLFP